MALINENLLKISRKYLFPIIEEKRDLLKSRVSDDEFVDLGVGDISMPIAPSIVAGLKEAADEVGEKVIGYGPYQGYSFLREAIAKVEYNLVEISPDEIFVSEGINADICGMQELFSTNSKVGIMDPTYPVYLDLNIMAGREQIIKIPLTSENHFIPEPPNERLDFVYLTSPSNPTGVAMTRTDLKKWIDWAKEVECVIFFDAAYASFIQSADVPKTIYEIEGARDVAIEFRSFSKSAGFTGIRLGYCVVPKELEIKSTDGRNFNLNKLWLNRQSVKTNGVSYPIQKAGLAALSPKGISECNEQVFCYLKGAMKIRKSLEKMGFRCVGAINSPYIWWEVPGGDSWEWFDRLLNVCSIVSIPGEGFGSFGEGYIRLSGFVTPDEADRAVKNLERLGAIHED